MNNSRMVDLPESEALAVLEGDLDDFLPRRVRDVLLSLILAWARFDTAIAFLAASASGLNPDEGANKYGRSQLVQKLTATAKALREMGDGENATIVDRLKEASPPFAKLRNRVAHARCVGVRRSNPSHIVFLPYQTEGPPGNLAIEIYDLAQFVSATDFADDVYSVLMRGLGESGFFDPSLSHGT